MTITQLMLTDQNKPQLMFTKKARTRYEYEQVHENHHSSSKQGGKTLIMSNRNKCCRSMTTAAVFGYPCFAIIVLRTWHY